MLLCLLTHLRCLKLVHGETHVFCLFRSLQQCLLWACVGTCSKDTALQGPEGLRIQLTPVVLYAQSSLGKRVILGNQAATTLQL